MTVIITYRHLADFLVLLSCVDGACRESQKTRHKNKCEEAQKGDLQRLNNPKLGVEAHPDASPPGAEARA